jgi:hypothetical protein
MNLRKLPWLAGRGEYQNQTLPFRDLMLNSHFLLLIAQGYNTWGIYANDVICRRSREPIRASYMVVLFESFTDPISTGREELGFSWVIDTLSCLSSSRLDRCLLVIHYRKVWAELPDPKEEDGKLVHTAVSPNL